MVGRGPSARSCRQCAEVADTVLRSLRSFEKTEKAGKEHRLMHSTEFVRLALAGLRQKLAKLKELLVKPPKHRSVVTAGTLLPFREQDALVYALIKALETKKITPDSWLYADLFTQVKCATAADARGFRWPPAIIAYWCGVP